MRIAGGGCSKVAGVAVRAATRDMMYLVDTALLPAALVSVPERTPAHSSGRKDATAMEHGHSTRPLGAGGAGVVEGYHQQEKENVLAPNAPAAQSGAAASTACPAGHPTRRPVPVPAIKPADDPIVIDEDDLQDTPCAAGSTGPESKRSSGIGARGGDKVGAAASADQTGGGKGGGGRGSALTSNFKKRSLEQVKRGNRGCGDAAAECGAGGSDDDDFKTQKPRRKLLHSKRK